MPKTQFYYYDIQTHQSIDSDRPRESDDADVFEVWDHLSNKNGSYLGLVVPGDGVSVQFAMDGTDDVAIDIPAPTKHGSYVSSLTIAQTRVILKLIMEGGSPFAIIPDLTFEMW